MGEEGKEELRKKHYSKKKQLEHHRLKVEKEDAELRLNRYISMGGVCSRRDADVLIAEGRVKVNGEVVQTVGIKVRKNDRVEVDDVLIVPERKVYLVLNKPKDYVTTVEDPLERKTVMSLIEDACKERIYPIGRLDRQTTGVLLFTNDGDLAKKLTHPKYEHKKIYHVFLNKPLDETDLEKISKGLELEDGFIKADEISYTSPDRSEVGIEIHSGRNRIVRRIFEHLGYDIVRLDRVYFAGITKKNLPRGRWRFLTSQEVRILKIYNT
nr:pseudouridine synthase [Odoribacter sp. OF09-27XD]